MLLTRRAALSGIAIGLQQLLVPTTGEAAARPVTVAAFGVRPWPAFTAAANLKRAIENGAPLDWLGWTIRLASPLIANVPQSAEWSGRGAQIVYDGASAAVAVKLVTGSGAHFSLNDITINANERCNIALLIESTGPMVAAATLSATALRTVNARRSNRFHGVPAIGLHVQGAFDSVELFGGGARDCTLPTGTGMPSIAGVCGIGISFLDNERWVKRCTVTDIDVANICADGIYQFDQDGLAYFAPDDRRHPSGKKESLLSVTGSRFTNCHGRSIKSQCRTTIVSDSNFARTAGQRDGVGNMEIDIQAGAGTILRNKFDYRNGQQPDCCVRLACDLVRGSASLNVEGNQVYLDDTTVLNGLAQSFSSVGNAATLRIVGNRINGMARMLLDFICNGSGNTATVTGNWMQQLLPRPDMAGEVAAVWVRRGGDAANARLSVSGNTHAGKGTPTLVRMRVPGSAMTATLTAGTNPGFVTP